jgi:hypothetical protein
MAKRKERAPVSTAESMKKETGVAHVADAVLKAALTALAVAVGVAAAGALAVVAAAVVSAGVAVLVPVAGGRGGRYEMGVGADVGAGAQQSGCGERGDASAGVGCTRACVRKRADKGMRDSKLVTLSYTHREGVVV